MYTVRIPLPYSTDEYFRKSATQSELISGVTGQGGAYLARLLLDKGYIVYNIKRRSSSFNTARIESFYVDHHQPNVNFFLHFGDLTEIVRI